MQALTFRESDKVNKKTVLLGMSNMFCMPMWVNLEHMLPRLL